MSILYLSEGDTEGTEETGEHTVNEWPQTELNCQPTGTRRLGESIQIWKGTIWTMWPADKCYTVLNKYKFHYFLY